MKVSNGKETYEVDENRLEEALKDGFVPTIKVSNGQSVFDVHPNDLKMAEADGFKPYKSEIESGLRGVAQGVSFGLADEITAGLESAFTDKTYEQARNESRDAYKSAQMQNPKAYMAGEVGGAIGAAFVPGLGALNVAKGTSLAARTGIAAAQGGLTGFGLSEADTVAGMAKDTAIGAGTGAVMQGVGEKVISPLVSKGGQLLKSGASKLDEAADWSLKKLGNGLANIDEADTERYLANRVAVNNSPSIGDLAEDVLKSSDSSDALLSQMYKKASELSSDAWLTLDKSRTISKSGIKQAIADTQDSLLTDGVLIGKSQARAHSDLQTIMQQIDGLNENIPETTMKRLIQMLDENIDWNDPSKNLTNESLSSVRQFIDMTLKKQNPAYKAKMEATQEVSEAIALVKKAFENRQNPEDFNKFLKGVKNLGRKDQHSLANKALDDIQKHTGQNLREDILNAQAKSAFKKDTTNGSRKTLLGTVIGSGVGTAVGPMGSVIGGAVGAAVGAGADKYSGLAIKSLLDGKISAKQFASQFANTKFSKVLEEAASRGNKSLAATHFLLSQQNQEYRKLLKDQDD